MLVCLPYTEPSISSGTRGSHDHVTPGVIYQRFSDASTKLFESDGTEKAKAASAFGMWIRL